MARPTTSTPSRERRITLLPALYPLVKDAADERGVSIADLANAALLQVFCPLNVASTQQAVAVENIAPNPVSDSDAYGTNTLNEW